MYTERLWKIEQVKKEIKKKQELQEWKDKLEVKKEVEGDTSETDALAEEIKKLQETIAEDKKSREQVITPTQFIFLYYLYFS